ncbi:hypothetical protein JYG30_03085 [Fibrella sp. USSR17]
MILTVCTSDQYGHAMLLVESLKKQHPDQLILVGQIGTATHTAPSGVTELAISDIGLSSAQLAELSARYTATEFRAALKPSLIKAAFKRYPDEQVLLYIDPTAYVYQPLTLILSQLEQHTILLNPHWLAAPTDDRLPDEKHLQNVGLFSSGFIGFRRCPETDRMLDWWESRCLDHAAINFCIGSCLDQLWLMHVPTLFDGVGILKNPGVQVALWNLPQRTLTETPDGWQVTGQGGPNVASPLLTADFLGLSKQNEGLFQQQNRLQIVHRPDVKRLLANYEQARLPLHIPTQSTVYGQQPEPVILRGWRRSVKRKLIQLSKWIDNVPIRPIHQ